MAYAQAITEGLTDSPYDVFVENSEFAYPNDGGELYYQNEPILEGVAMMAKAALLGSQDLEAVRKVTEPLRNKPLDLLRIRKMQQRIDKISLK